MTLRTRRPSGAVPYPLVLIEGEPKAGKSWMAATFSASKRTGQMYWMDVREGAADEYGAIPDADYLVLEHDGTWRQMIEQIREVRSEAERAAAADEPPVVFVIDSVSGVWTLIKEWVDAKARRRKSNVARLERDPDAEVDITMDLWNLAKERWDEMMAPLLTFPGIVVLIAAGAEVAVVEGGRPVPGKVDWRVEAHKTLPAAVSVWVRLLRGQDPEIVGARSVHAGIQPKVDKIRTVPDLTLERLIFDILKCPDRAAARDLPQAPDVSDLRETVLAATDVATLTAVYEIASEHSLLGIATETTDGTECTLLALLSARRKAIDAPPAAEDAGKAAEGAAEQQEGGK
jgi:hypothetical protein